MRPANYIPDASGLLATVVSLSAFAIPALAQNNDDNNSNNGGNTGGNGGNTGGNNGGNTGGNTGDEEQANTSTGKQEPSTTEEKGPEKTEPPKPAETDKGDDKTTETEEQKETTTSESSSTTSDVKTTETTQQVTITGPAGTETEITSFATLSKQIGIPTYPAPAVPPVGDAPFMQQSTLPDGTVFIAVGAILGAFGFAILLWRFIVSCMLHRSVQRAAMAQHSTNSKTSFPAPPAPFYKYTDQGSAMSLSAAGGTAGRGVRRTNRGPTPSSNPSQSNLFFSPTAAQNNAGGGNRASTFLPSGFYAANSGSPSPNHGHSISLTNLRPDSRGQYVNASRNTLNPSPPGSPHVGARRDMSASSLNLNAPPGNERAPSAYLEDLLADDPSSFPPPQMPGSSHSRHSANLTSRTGSPGYRS
jgi:hypothetical protein